MTAAVATNEAAVPGLERAGLETPNRFSITGLVANRRTEPCHTRLTAFDVPASEIVATALRLPREHLTGPVPRRRTNRSLRQSPCTTARDLRSRDAEGAG